MTQVQEEFRSEPVRLSVVIPAYNAEQTICQTLRSVELQTGPSDEIIVVDDGSSDGTRVVLEKQFPHVRVLHQKNSGLAVARRAGIDAARGAAIALMDADDLCLPHRFEIQRAILERHPEVLLCASDFSAFDSDGVLATSYAATYYSAIGARGGLAALFGERELQPLSSGTTDGGGAVEFIFGRVYEFLALGNFLHPPTVMFRRSALELAGNFDRDAGPMCDWEWLVRVARCGPVGYICHPLLDYRISDSQMSSPRYRLRGALATIKAIGIICGHDPDLLRRERRHFTRLLGECCLDAADAGVESDRPGSWRWLARSVFQYHFANGQSPRVLFKLLMPASALNMLRDMRR